MAIIICLKEIKNAGGDLFLSKSQSYCLSASSRCQGWSFFSSFKNEIFSFLNSTYLEEYTEKWLRTVTCFGVRISEVKTAASKTSGARVQKVFDHEVAALLDDSDYRGLVLMLRILRRFCSSSKFSWWSGWAIWFGKTLLFEQLF